MSSEHMYETLEKIGHGSSGVIRKVRRNTDGLILCRKEISYRCMSQNEQRQLHTEFHILSSLQHPNIVAYDHYDDRIATQDFHLYMEYCENGDLGQTIKKLLCEEHYAQENFVWSIFSQLLLALHRCHSGIGPSETSKNARKSVLGSTASHLNGSSGATTILHRDLKPENVFLGKDNTVKLGDFGLSKVLESHEFACASVGSPLYMSPEVCSAENYTLKSDVWSLGCIIYELCSRKPPFNANNHLQLVQRIKDGRVGHLPAIYSKELNQAVNWCLQVNPDNRPDTAELLNLPFVKLSRKEHELLLSNEALQAKAIELKKKEMVMDETMLRLEAEKQLFKAHAHAAMCLEWEGKARLEIDRIVTDTIEKLREDFEDEVNDRVGAVLLAVPVSSVAEPGSAQYLYNSTNMPTHALTSTYKGGDRNAWDRDSAKTLIGNVNKFVDWRYKDSKTPLRRAQSTVTGTIGTPMDIEMASPSPMAIAPLSLSPRLNVTVKPLASRPANIFAVDTARGRHHGWSTRHESAQGESDDDDIVVPTPTRQITTSKHAVPSPINQHLRRHR